MTKNTENLTPEAAWFELELQSYTGDPERYPHPLDRSVFYTRGVRHLAEGGQAYWLIDAIASWIGSTPFNEASKLDARIKDMHFWTLEVSAEQSAVLSAKADSPCAAFIEQRIEWTDFPLPMVEVWAGFDGEHWTLYLPSEH